MEKWQESFKKICQEMQANNEVKRTLPLRGQITFLSEKHCPNCYNQGVFHGEELECGLFYECASAYFCPKCQSIFEVAEGENFSIDYPEKFLPIMKKKLIEKIEKLDLDEISLIKSLMEEEKDVCPVCGGVLYTFYKDFGYIDSWHNYWTVCINPACLWPGRYKVYFESGLK